jgi:hypothetical protein
MENNENFVAEQAAENVEQTTEQTVAEPAKLFTQEDLNAAVGKAKARERAKIEKQYKRQYGDLVDVLKAGTGKENVEEVTDTFRDFYQKKGIQIPQTPNYSAADIEVLARAEADEIIRSGYEDVVEETDRLSEIGYENMTAREKAVFKTLAEHRQAAERGRELAKLGVTEEVYNSQAFRDFAGKFNPSTPITEVYEIFSSRQPKKEFKTMGSMRNNSSGDSGVKDFYTFEEASKIPKEEYDKNPALFAAVRKSMQKWK